MSEVITHPGDVGPRDVRLGSEEVRIDGLHRLTDFDQPDSYGVEDEAIDEIAAGQVLVDGLD